VIDDRRQEVLLMARVASRRQSYELSSGCVLVALIAFDQCMRSNQRESILVILDLLDIYLPAFDGVAALAIGTELPAMNVCVALRALSANLLEH